MKKFFYSVLAAATMLFATTSCSEDDPMTPEIGHDGKTQKVTFSVQLPDQTESRAIADGVQVGQGNMANTLRYALYEVDDTGVIKKINGEEKPLVTGLGYEDTDKNFTVNIDMVKGLKYKILFLAYNERNCIFQLAGEDNDGDGDGDDLMSLDLIDELLANQESYDAFVACHEYNTIDANRDNTVELYRPFAQINVGTTDTDLQKAAILNATVVESALEMEVPTQYNVFTGAALNEANKVYAKSSILYQNGTTDNEILCDVDNVDYNYLNMVYVLVGENKTKDATFTFYRSGDEKAIRTLNVTNLPIKQNYRTNIVGSIITKTESFQVKIDNKFTGDYNNEHFEKDETGTYHVTSAEGLIEFMEKVNAGDPEMTGATVTLDGDIDLSALASRSIESNWTPIGTSEKPFTGTFDGRGYTIKNLVINGGSNSNIGFFGVTHDGEIKNLTIENAIVSGRLNVGVVAGTPYTSKYTNITVKGHVEVNGMAYVGAVGGKNAYANWTNITVNVDETSYVNANSIEDGTAYRTYVGGVCGFNGEGGHTFSDIYSNINVKGSTCDVGGLFGIAHYGNNFVNCVCEGNVEIYAASEEDEAQQIGGIAGVWHNENGTKVTFTNCSFNGELKANDNFVINTDKFGNLVCASYNTTGTGTLVIDGNNYTLNNGNVLINGCTPVATADELVAALEANEGVFLLKDIKIDPAAMSNAYGKTGINVKNGQTIDGGGHTLNIQGAGGTWDSGINTTGGLIKNITVTGSFRGIFINHTSTHSEKVVLENVTIGGNGTVYTISCDEGLYQGIEATNCTFNGWTSFAKTAGEAKFINCTFGEGSGYKYCRPYSDTEFVNCTFCPGYAVDSTRATVTFTDCTWEE